MRVPPDDPCFREEQMYIVTGAAGFIGGNVVKRLNRLGITDVLAVDDLSNGAKYLNLRDSRIADYMDVEEFRGRLERGAGLPKAEGVLHQGAWADTMGEDGRRMLDLNFAFSKAILRYAIDQRAPFVYASSAAVYGGSTDSAPVPGNERPLNLYGWSKLLFDQYVRRLQGPVESTVVGLRYANVYGPGEWHKGRMASMPYQLYRQLTTSGVARLFQGTDGYRGGEHRRDFVFVEDVVAVNAFFMARAPVRAIVNVGTGIDRSFNDVANGLIRLLGRGTIEYIPFPASLLGKYQNRTCSDLGSLREAGFDMPMTPLEEGLAKAVVAWQTESTVSPGLPGCVRSPEAVQG